MQCTPPEIMQEAKEAASSLGPSKSAEKYSVAYRHFIEWCDTKGVSKYSENVLLAYFNYLLKEKKWKSSTLWSRYSMVKSELIIKQGVDISQYLKLRAFLKKTNEGYCAKKSRIFSKEQFERFLCEAPDTVHLGMKIVLLIGVSGACRCDEMVKMATHDIEDLGNLIVRKIPDSKTRKVRSFTIIGETYLKIYRSYAVLRPKNMEEKRFFLKYQNGKCFRNVMGIHTIAGTSRKVASFLGLSSPEEYTGHCLRRTSATLLIDGGGNIESLKRHGGWKSTGVAEGYIEESLRNKNDTASKILNLRQNIDEIDKSCTESSSLKSSVTSTVVNATLNSQQDATTVLRGFNFQNATISHCTFNIHLNDK